MARNMQIERALTLWISGAITMEIVQHAKNTNKGEVLHRHLVNTDEAALKFDEASWGAATEGFADSVEEIEPEDFEKILEAAWELTKPTKAGRKTVSSAAAASVAVDRRAMLVKKRPSGNCK